MAKIIAQRLVLNMRRTGAFMNILRHKIVMEGAARTALTAIAAQATQ
ncbi:Uncharacterised protein [Salmonella enterica subsp. enterica serovar Bovismorbificans]|uniref:Uncharacterized protein n=1 Tax=Salmonella enterica subsp. enterica serovar Bovismorbificans TaxID=58097 RepID=A0A655D1I6_SALET|nr:Uncharacterised protein [Salmonella enterica subsp. enterica serovar Bovismorbificans]